MARPSEVAKLLLALLEATTLPVVALLEGSRELLESARREHYGYHPRTIRRRLKRLETDGLVRRTSLPDGREALAITEAGKRALEVRRFASLTIPVPETWDEKWRVVSFDVPEKRRVVRDALRQKLRHLGFYELQKSVFVHPNECEKEITFLKEFFEAEPWISYMVVEYIDDDGRIREHFGVA